MSRRRSLMVFALAAVVAGGAAPAALARPKVVVAGGPPPKAGQAPGVNFPKELNLNGFFRRRITIHVGDSVRWVFSRRVVHTVTFLAPGQKRPTLEQPDPSHPYSGFMDAAGAPFWFNGQPSLLIPTDHALPVGGGSTDGTKYLNSGLSAPAFHSYKVRFTKTGTFRYLCLVHPGMAGTVKVRARGRRIPSAAQDAAARRAEYGRAVKRARELARFKPGARHVVGGHDTGTVAWFRFFPRVTKVRVGQSVRFSVSSKSEIHTVAFGPEAYRDDLEKNLVLVQPQPSGPPRFEFNPQIFLPSDPVLPPYTGTNHGNGFLNTGIMDTDAASSAPGSTTVTFAKRGTYVFECTIHPGMEATIKVA